MKTPVFLLAAVSTALAGTVFGAYPYPEFRSVPVTNSVQTRSLALFIR